MSDTERRQRTISSTPRLTPDEVAARSFPTAFRGISETDVRAFLKRVAEDLGAARGREQELMTTIDELEARLRSPRPLDESELLDALGEETTRLLRSAREAAIDIRAKAEERAARLVHDAHETSDRVRQEADEVLGVRTHEADTVAQSMLEEAEQRATDLMRVADERAAEVRSSADRYAEELRARAERESAAELEGARSRGAALLVEAANLRQRVIDDLGRRRELLSGQLEELRTGRDELLDAYRIVKRTFLEATEALAQVEARATAGRPAPGTDPADLDAAVAAEAEAAHAAGLAPSPSAPETAADTATDVATDDPDASTTADDATDDPDASTTADDATASDAAVPEEPESDAAMPETAGSEPAGSEPAGSEEGGSEDTGPNLAAVDDLFARLRAGAQAEAQPEPETDGAAPESRATGSAPDPQSAVAAPDATPGDNGVPAAAAPIAVGGEPVVEEAPEWLVRRTALLTPLRAALVRQVKLAIGNEQNEVLDKVRRHKGRPASASVLPDPDVQAIAWSAVLGSSASQAYLLGRGTSDDGSADAAAADAGATGVAHHETPADLAPTLARAMVEPLRDRLVATIDGAHEPGETSNQVAERIGARYREWKNRSAESSTEDALVAAYARGHYDRAGDGAVLTWSVPPGGCCVDCADNALEPTRKGQDFPTGQAYPPAHPGCRCSLTSTGTAADSSVDVTVDVTGEPLNAESSSSS